MFVVGYLSIVFELIFMGVDVILKDNKIVFLLVVECGGNWRRFVFELMKVGYDVN